MAANKILEIFRQVEQEYNGLGRPVIFSLIMYYSRLPCILISETGCGKSQIVDLARSMIKQHFVVDSFTRSSLEQLKEVVQDRDTLLITKDLGALADVRQINENLSTGITLSTEGEFIKYIQKSAMRITGFTGSYLTTAQPRIIRELIQFSNFENFIREKSIRYYHLLRSNNHHSHERNIMFIKEEYERNEKHSDPEKLLLSNATRYCRFQTSGKRSIDYANRMVKVCQKMSKKSKMSTDDCVFFDYVLRPMTVEQYCLSRYNLNTELNFSIDIFNILMELSTYEEPRLVDIADDYGLGRHYIVSVLKSVENFWQKSHINSPVVMKSELSKNILGDAGYDH